MNKEEHTMLIAKVKTTMLKPSLCDYNDAYICIKGKIIITGAKMMQQLDKQMKSIKVYHLKIILHLLTA